jgi:hypothetical protein
VKPAIALALRYATEQELLPRRLGAEELFDWYRRVNMSYSNISQDAGTLALIVKLRLSRVHPGSIVRSTTG